MSAYTFAIAAVILTAMRQVILRAALRDGQDEWPILILYHIGAPILLISINGVPVVESASLTTIVLLVFSCAAWVLYSVCDLKSHAYLDVAAGAILSTLNFVLIVVGGVIIFDEHITVPGALGAALIVASALRATRAPTNFNFSAGVRYKLVGITVLAANMLFTKYLTTQIDSMFVAIMGFYIPAVLYVLLKPEKIREIPSAVRGSRGLVLLLPFVSAMNYYSLVRALELGNVSTTYSILQTSVVFVFLFGATMLGERDNLMRRGVSCALCAVGAFIVCQY
ncbi:MAG: EamA family transporter [Bdellovibrionales bacterium]|nr:EamA family transporter [Bdellovibrionales bacterium]